MRKLMIICIDGATLDLIKPWAHKEILPTFKKLIAEGSYGKLKSTTPPLTAPAWVSFATGKNPGKHGIFDFVQRESNSYKFRFVDASKRKSTTFWKIASNHGKKVGVFYLPLTYPPEEVNGFIIPGLGAPKRQGTIYPQKMRRELIKLYGYVEIVEKSRHIPKGDRAKVLKESVSKITKICLDISRYLVKKYMPDLFITYFEEVENSHHYAWKYFDDRLPTSKTLGTKAYRDLIKTAYVEVDKALGKLIDEFKEEYDFIIVSDHGYGLRYKAGKHKFIGGLLAEIDLMRLKTSKQLIFRGFNKDKLYNILSKLKLNAFLARIIPRKIISALPEKINLEDVNWKETIAYSYGDPSYVYINLKGREQEGIVKKEEYERVRDEITRKLREIKDPKIDESVFEMIYKREELFQGNSLEKAPDIICITREIPTVFDGERFENNFSSSIDMITDWHQQHGIFFAYGKSFAKGKEVNCEIIDIAPTALYFLGVPIPRDIDGRVVTKIFEKKLEPPKYLDVEQKKKTLDYKKLSEKEEKEIKRRLEDLGYLV